MNVLNLVSSLETQLNYTFTNKHILVQALTKTKSKNQISESNNNNENNFNPLFFDNEILELLGDSVLNLIIINHLLDKNDNSLSSINDKMKQLVNNKTLRDFGWSQNLINYIIKDGNKKIGDKAIADTVESVIGAIFIDTNQDYFITKNVVLNWMKDFHKLGEIDPIPKSLLKPANKIVSECNIFISLGKYVSNNNNCIESLDYLQFEKNKVTIDNNKNDEKFNELYVKKKVTKNTLKN